MYGGVAVCTCGAHEVEVHAPIVCFVDGVGEDYARGASSGLPSEGESEAADDEHLVEPLKVAIVLLQSYGTEVVARLLESGGDVFELGHGAEWEGERVGGRPDLFLISDLAYYIEERHCGRY